MGLSNGGLLDSNASLTVSGSVSVSDVATFDHRGGGTFDVSSGSITATGTDASNRTTVVLGGTWAAGTGANITVTDTDVELAGSLDTAEYDAFDTNRNPVSPVSITGTIVNTSDILDLDDTNGQITLTSGTIQDGTVASTAGHPLHVGSSTGTIDNIELDIPVDFTAAGGTLRVVNGLQLDATIELSGLSNLNLSFDGSQTVSTAGGGAIVLGGASISDAQLFIEGGDTLTLGAGVSLSTANAGGDVEPKNTSALVNQGTITVSTGLLQFGATNYGGSRIFTNDTGGTITIDGGELQLSGTSSTNGGTITVAAGTLDANTTLDNQGTLRSGSSGVGSVQGVVDSSGVVLGTGTGELSFDSAPSNFSSGTLSGGSWMVEDSGVLRFPSGTAISTNAATLTLSGSGQVLADTSDALAGLNTNASAGVFNLRLGALFTAPSSGAFANQGTVDIDGTSTFAAPAGFDNSGVLSGTGTVDGNVTNSSGDVAPGGSVGSLSVTGDLDMGSGTVTIEIAGRADGTFDTISVGGTASGGGTIDVTLLDGFVPIDTDDFEIVTAASTAGSAPAVSGSGAAADMRSTLGPDRIELWVGPASGARPRINVAHDGVEDADTLSDGATVGISAAGFPDTTVRIYQCVNVVFWSSGGFAGATTAIDDACTQLGSDETPSGGVVNTSRSVSVSSPASADSGTSQDCTQRNVTIFGQEKLTSVRAACGILAVEIDSGTPDLADSWYEPISFNGGFVCAGQQATIIGTVYDDTYTGTDDPEVIYDPFGADTYNGAGGDDRICSGTDNDTVIGGPGADIIGAGPGLDVLIGGNEAAGVCDGSNPDLSDDILAGGSGNDTVYGCEGNDEIITSSGADTIHGGAGNDFINAQSGDDTLNGNDGDDTLLGRAGNDTCDGGAGNDTLDGCETVISATDISLRLATTHPIAAAPTPPAALLASSVWQAASHMLTALEVHPAYLLATLLAKPDHPGKGNGGGGNGDGGGNNDSSGCTTIGAGADLRGCDLSGRDLSGLDLTNARLDGANLANSDLSHTNLEGANLNNTDLRRTDLSHARLVDVRTNNNTNLEGADTTNAAWS